MEHEGDAQLTIYVDALRSTAQSPEWPFKHSCHLYADTQIELFETAERLKLKDTWFQHHKRLPHFDIVASKRKSAIGLGAIPQTRQEVAMKMRDSEFRKQWNIENA